MNPPPRVITHDERRRRIVRESGKHHHIGRIRHDQPQGVGAAATFGDLVAIALAPDDQIVAVAAIDAVVAGAPFERIVATTAIERVIAATTIQRIAAGARNRTWWITRDGRGYPYRLNRFACGGTGKRCHSLPSRSVTKPQAFAPKCGRI